MQANQLNTYIDQLLYSITGPRYFTENDIDTIAKYIASCLERIISGYDRNSLIQITKLYLQKKHEAQYHYRAGETINSLEADDVSEESSCLSVSDDDVKDIKYVLYTKCNYINSELDEYPSGTHKDHLVSHRHDCPTETFTKKCHIRRKKRIEFLKTLPQYPQKSQEWLDKRKGCLTATAIATVIDEDPYTYPAQLLVDKCGRGPPFVENKNVHNGRKYEDVGTMFYAFRNNVNVAEYGLLPDDNIEHLGISPDGVCEETRYDGKGLSNMVGRLLEIKFPTSRKIVTHGALDGDLCPHYYYIQVQAQLFVTQMDECDFLQCKIEEYDTYEEFKQDTHSVIPGLSAKTNLEKGCLIQLLPKDKVAGDPEMCLYNAQYLYPPKLHMTELELKDWIATETMNYHQHHFSSEYLIDRVIYWRLSQVTCNLITADTAWFKSKLPMLEQFWNYVEFYRENSSLLDKLIEHINNVGLDNSSEIFRKVHKDYQKVHPDSGYHRLYKTETEWRKKFNVKYAYLKKYRSNRIEVV